MDRKQFLRLGLPLLASAPLIPSVMKLAALRDMTAAFGSSEKMPVLFLGHGSPMNAIEENEFVQEFRQLGQRIRRPNAILCISAHWETRGTFVTAMEHPRTIHDFGGFPKALFDVQYPAPGSPQLAQTTVELIQSTPVGLDHSWGLDHGAWSVIKHLYPDADVPVIQMSIDYTQGPAWHYALARELAALRTKGVLIVGSGNMVHNLGLVAWNRLNESFAFDWALEASERMKSYMLGNDFEKMIHYQQQGTAFRMAIPTPEHYYPLLYALALKEDSDALHFFNDKPVAGALTMTSVAIGRV
jgi:4,5-DOPA dioxygenase extradiol